MKAEDFKLTPEEVKELVGGAQKFLAPTPDPEDDEPLRPKRPLADSPD